MTPAPPAPGGEIIVYQAADGAVQVEARLERDTVWLTQQQMAELFGRERSVISKHARKVFRDGELDEKSNVQNLHIAGSDKPVGFYSLDVIISVGYRVKSARGTQFRIWATGVLRDHLVKGYTANAARLRDLNQAVRLVADTARRRELSGDEAEALLAVVGEYNRALELLDDYDHQRVAKPRAGAVATWVLRHEEALRLVGRLRGRFGGSALFGVEKDQSLASALGAVMQTFGGEDLYPSLEEKVAQLLYLQREGSRAIRGQPLQRDVPAALQRRRDAARVRPRALHQRPAGGPLRAEEALKRVMRTMLKDDTELFRQFMDNESFRRWMTDTVFSLTYERPEAAR